MGKKRFTKENISKVPNSGGVYCFYDKNGKKIYVGMTAGNVGKQWGPDPDDRFRYGLRHRLQSYYQEDDHREHPTKKNLRPEIHFFDARVVTSDKQRSIIEKREKQGLKYNHL
jgi:excinuclease UvrABC nuclease subunit